MDVGLVEAFDVFELVPYGDSIVAAIRKWLIELARGAHENSQIVCADKSASLSYDIHGD